MTDLKKNGFVEAPQNNFLHVASIPRNLLLAQISAEVLSVAFPFSFKKDWKNEEDRCVCAGIINQILAPELI
jgi:hypothetical protein